MVCICANNAFGVDGLLITFVPGISGTQCESQFFQQINIIVGINRFEEGISIEPRSSYRLAHRCIDLIIRVASEVDKLRCSVVEG
ncbi:hypothetical protein D3C81_939400 [compost metagenome]